MEKKSQPEKKIYSWETYQELEKSGDIRYEYHDGQIVAMAGASNPHNEIVLNCYTQFRPATKKRGCKTFAMEVKLFRHLSEQYFYPDVMATCQSFDLQSKDGIRSPFLLIEVLSKSTQEADRGLKLREYFKLPSLQHYLLIEQSSCYIQHYRRRADQSWEILLYEELIQSIDIPELDLQLTLAEIYEGIEFGPEPDMVSGPIPIYEIIEHLEKGTLHTLEGLW